MHACITDIDYIHWQSCGVDVLMKFLAGNLLSCDRERLKNYINVICTIQKTRDTKRNLCIICHLCMPIASSNIIGLKKSKL